MLCEAVTTLFLVVISWTILSQEMEELVSSGKADIDGDGVANLDLINSRIEDNNKLLDDEDWV